MTPSFRLLYASFLLTVCHQSYGEIIYKKVIAGQGTLVCELLERPKGSAQNQQQSQMANRLNPRVDGTIDYRLLWTPVGFSSPEPLWRLAISQDRINTGAALFLPFDACLLPDRHLLIVFRDSLRIYSVDLELGRKYDSKEPRLIPVVAEINKERIRIFGSGFLRREPTTGNISLLLDGSGGPEVFGYDGSSWRYRGLEPSKPFEKELPGFGKICVQGKDVELPILPVEFQARLEAQLESPEMKALLADVTTSLKSSAYIQSLHRYECFLLRNGSPERIPLFKKTTYYDPYRSRCPTGFCVFDVMAVGNNVYVVFKEQAAIRWARIEINEKTVVSKESPQPIVGEGNHLTFSGGTLSEASTGGDILLALSGSDGKRSFRLRGGSRWQPVENEWPK